MKRDNIKNIFRRIGISLPAGLPPPVSSLYTQYLSQLSSEEQQNLLIELKDLSEDQYEALSCDLRVNKEQIKQLVKILEEIQPNFDKIKEISAKTFENTELIKAYFEERTKQLLKKFQYGKKLEKEDIIEGLVSWNIKVRTMAAFYAGKYSIKETTKFLIKNLSAPEDDLILLSIRSLSQIRAVEAFNYILPFINHPNNKLATEARWYLRNSDLINQENFDMWPSWLLGHDEELKRISIGNLYCLQLKGRLDVKSIKKELKNLLRDNDADIREMAIRLLSEIEGISNEVDFEKFLYDKSEGRFVKSAIPHALFLDNRKGIIAQFLNYLMEKECKDILLLQNISRYCFISDDDFSKKTIGKFREYYKEQFGFYPDSSLSRMDIKRVKPQKDAIRKNKTSEDIQKLLANKDFQKFILNCSQCYGNFRDIALIIIDTNKSGITPESIAHYLEIYHNFVTIDYRNKDEIFIESQAEVFQNNLHICMLLPSYIKSGLGTMFYWLLEKNEINFEGYYPNPQAFKLNDFVKLVGVMTKEDYLNLEIKGMSKSKFEQMTTPKSI